MPPSTILAHPFQDAKNVLWRFTIFSDCRVARSNETHSTCRQIWRKNVAKKGEKNLERLQQAYDAYVRYQDTNVAARSLEPPVVPERLRQMLRSGHNLGLFTNPLHRTKREQHEHRIERIISVKRLYDERGSLKAAGQAMRPPITGARVGQLLREGVKRGLFEYVDPRFTAYTAEEIAQALLEHGSVKKVAQHLQINENTIYGKYASALHVLPHARRERLKAAYLSIVEKLGCHPAPTPTEMGRNLYLRIKRAFGSVDEFLRELEHQPLPEAA
jgi:hypothetical protein